MRDNWAVEPLGTTPRPQVRGYVLSLDPDQERLKRAIFGAANDWFWDQDNRRLSTTNGARLTLPDGTKIRLSDWIEDSLYTTVSFRASSGPEAVPFWMPMSLLGEDLDR